MFLKVIEYVPIIYNTRHGYMYMRKQRFRSFAIYLIVYTVLNQKL